MTKKLYIIGNGFDLHHYLKTSYNDFARYLKKNHNDIYTTLERYIFFPISDDNLWSRFEENLANLDAEEILSEHSDTLPNYASDDFRDRDRFIFPDIMDEHFQKLTFELFTAFEEFIRLVEFPRDAWENKIEIDKESSFLTFNYTNTLENIYSIDKTKILYIHNSAHYGSEGIILGHGIPPENFEEKKPEPPDNIEPEQLEEWYNRNYSYDYSYDEGKENLMRFFKQTYKPTKEIIKRHSNFFAQLKTIDEIFVFGHSISTIDLPYFEEIAKNIKKEIKWTVSYYSSVEHANHIANLTKLGINEDYIHLIKLEEIQENNRQLKINF